MASLFGLGGGSDKKNRGIVYKGAYKVAVEEIPYPSFEMTVGGKNRKMPHAAILKVVATNICGSDGHMYRGRTGVTPGTIFGHEITGEVVEIGSDVECIKVGDLVSVPFNIACGRCKNCKRQKTNLCLNVNPEQPGGAYGYVLMGGWPGGQSEYVLVPYADFNLLKVDKELGMKRILDVALLSDILPTGYDAAVRAMVGTGSNVYIAGAGPVGICCAASCFLLGAANVIVADYEPDRLKQCKLMGCDVIDLNTNKSVPDAIESILGENTCDSAIDCVGFEACGHHGNQRKTVEQKSEVLNTCFEAAKFGGNVGIPGVYMPADAGDKDKFGSQGGLALYYGNGWNKGLTITQGQCPVMCYNEELKAAVLSGRLEVAKYLNINLISLDEAPKAYEDFSRGANKKYVIDPHNMVSRHLVTK